MKHAPDDIPWSACPRCGSRGTIAEECGAPVDRLGVCAENPAHRTLASRGTCPCPGERGECPVCLGAKRVVSWLYVDALLETVHEEAAEL